MNYNGLIKNKNFQDGLFFIICAVALLGYSLVSYSNDFTKAWSQSPYLFPVIVAIILFVLGAVLLKQGCGGAEKASSSPAEDTTSDPKSALITLALVVAYFLLLPFAGFLFATIPFLAMFIFFLGERKPLVLAFVSVGVSVVLYLLFSVLLNVQLP